MPQLIITNHEKLYMTNNNDVYNFLVCCPTSGSAVTLKTERREVAGSNPARACRPSRSEFSVVFYETIVNTG